MSYIDSGYYLIFSYTWERVCVCVAVFALIYAWANVYPTFMAIIS